MAERPAIQPRLMSLPEAAAYCNVGSERFEQTVASVVPPLRCFGRKKLWDRRALDRWLDRLSALDDAPEPDGGSIMERLNGVHGAGR